jgi:hypothetical protein
MKDQSGQHSRERHARLAPAAFGQGGQSGAETFAESSQKASLGRCRDIMAAPGRVFFMPLGILSRQTNTGAGLNSRKALRVTQVRQFAVIE